MPQETTTPEVPAKLQPFLEPIGGVSLSARNVKKGHSVEEIANSLAALGWHAPIVATKDGEVLVGNGRLKAARYLGLAEVPVLRVSDNNEQAIARMIADNRTSELSEWDLEQLQELIDDVDVEGMVGSLNLEEVLADLGDPTMDTLDFTSTDKDGQGIQSTIAVRSKGARTVVLGLGEKRFLLYRNWAEHLEQWLEEKHDSGLQYHEALAELIRSVAGEAPPLEGSDEEAEGEEDEELLQ